MFLIKTHNRFLRGNVSYLVKFRISTKEEHTEQNSDKWEGGLPQQCSELFHRKSMNSKSTCIQKIIRVILFFYTNESDSGDTEKAQYPIPTYQRSNYSIQNIYVTFREINKGNTAKRK